MAKTKTKTKRGRPIKHGGYSIIVRQGELPESRKHVREYLNMIRAGIISDLGPTEEDLTTAQIVLIDRLVSLLSVVRMIEEYAKEKGAFSGDRLSESLRESYISYNNSIRLILDKLGIEKRAVEDIDPIKYIQRDGKPDEKS